MNIFVDTSIFVDCLRLNPIGSSKDFLESIEGENRGFTSTIVVAELSVGAYLSPRSDALENTLKIISTTSIIDLNQEITMLGGKIYAELVREGKEIVTRNVEHFNKIKGLKATTPEDLGF